MKTLGNLAIIPQSLNSSVKNSSWQVKLHGNGKKKGLLEYATGLETMKIPLSSENWNETTIRDRSHWLSDHARVVWNFEDVPYEESFADSVVSESNPNSSRQISAHIEKPKRTNNHDRTKYSFDGINFYNKNEFVFRLIKEYMTLHPDTTYKKIRSLFPISIMDNGGSPLSGIVASMSDIMIDVQKGMYREALINKYYKVDNSERRFTTADGSRLSLTHSGARIPWKDSLYMRNKLVLISQVNLLNYNHILKATSQCIYLPYIYIILGDQRP